MGKKYATLFIPKPNVQDIDEIGLFYSKKNLPENNVHMLLASLDLSAEAKRMFSRWATIAEPFVIAIKNRDRFRSL